MTGVAKSAKLARLTRAYDALAPAGREIVDVLSVLVMPVSRTLLQFCLMARESPAAGASEWNSKRLNSLIGDLLGSGLVEEVEKRKVRCLPSFREIPIRRAAREGRLDPLAAAVRPVLARNEPWHESRLYAYERSLRDFRIELYLRRWDLADQRLAACRQLCPPGDDPLIEVLTEPFDPDILDQLPPGAVADFLVGQFSQVVQTLEPIDEAVLAYAEELWKKHGRKTPLPVRGLLAEQKILRGDLDEALALVEGLADVQAGGVASIHGWVAFLRGDDIAAINHFEADLKLVRSTTRKRKIFLAELSGLFFLLALLRTGDRGRLQEARVYIEAALVTRVHHLRGGYEALLDVVAVLLAERTVASVLPRLHPGKENPQFTLDSGTTTRLDVLCPNRRRRPSIP